MISETFYKDRPAIKVAGDNIEALFLPYDGAKLASIKVNGLEFFAQNNSKNYLRLGIDSSYVKRECSAFDDMFPTIDPCEINGFSYPDHGEVCRIPFEYKIGNNAVFFKTEVKSVNAVFSKLAYSEKDSIFIEYEIENRNNFKLPCIWAGHIMLAGEEGATVMSYFEENAAFTVMFGNPSKVKHRLTEYGENKEYKFYYDDAKPPMECTVDFPKTNRKLNFKFSGDVVRYLGIWMNPGDLNGMYNLAIEPCTAPYDTPIKAEEAGKGSYLPPRNKVKFVLKIKGEQKNEGF